MQDISKFRSLLQEYSKEIGKNIDVVKLSKEQQNALDMIKAGKNVLILGSGGTGKSMLIRELKESIHGVNIKVTSSTGISAYNIEGMTIHSFMGIGTGEASLQTLVKRVRSNSLATKAISETNILVIDEISMLSAELFEKLDYIAQVIKKNNAFFGGIQVVLTGDFYQLEAVFKKQQDTRLIFQSPVFTSAFNKKRGNIVTLVTNFRQDDKIFKEALLRIREGTFKTDDITLIKNRIGKQPDDKSIIHLVTSNKKANEINQKNINLLSGGIHEYETHFTTQGNEIIAKDLLVELESQFRLKGILKICLKKGARVMLTKNLDVKSGLVNGAVGVVSGIIDGLPEVKFDNGITKLINKCTWDLEYDDITKVMAEQIPLMLAWSITIHKSQSLTLDRAFMDLSSCFCNHHVYVALSRVKSLNGLYIKSFDPNKIMVNKMVAEYLSTI
jgi:ATP-dependent DNA helicase PIF1